MSDRLFPISRRRLLKLTGLAPLAALATKAQGADTTGATTFDLTVADLPTTAMNKLKGLARDYNSNVDLEGFAKVARALWHFFQEGVKDIGGVLPPESEAEDSNFMKLVGTTYTTQNSETPRRRCGDLVVDKLGDWEARWKVNTDICAWVCGAYAAHNASGRPINEADFEYGYEETERRMKKLMDRARAMYGDGSAHRGGGC